MARATPGFLHRSEIHSIGASQVIEALCHAPGIIVRSPCPQLVRKICDKALRISLGLVQFTL